MSVEAPHITSSACVCRACGAATKALFAGQVLDGVAVTYHECTNCRTLQLPSPHWLAQAYGSNPRPDPDTGRLMRAMAVHRVIRRLRAMQLLPRPLRALDEGAGLGFLVRLLRDEGVEAWGQDPYARPVVAEAFVAERCPDGAFGLISATEVVEHTENTAAFLLGLAERLQPGGVLLLTTELYEPDRLNDVSQWPYLAPQFGQHITFLSPAGLRAVSAHVGLTWWASLDFAGARCIHLLGHTAPSRWTVRRLQWRHARAESRLRGDAHA